MEFFKKTRSIIAVFFCLFTFLFQAQNRKLDSLITIANSSRHDTLRAMAMGDIAKIYLKNKDTVAYKENEERFEKLFNTSKSPKVGSLYYLVKANYVEKFRNNQELVLDYFKKSYDCCIKANDKTTAGKRINKIGKLLMDLGKYEESIKILYEAVKLNEENGNKVSLSYSYFGLGEVFRLQKNNKKALEVYYSAYKLSQLTQDPQGLAASYNNLGMMYHTLEMLDSAEYYYIKAVDFNTKRADEAGMANSLDRLATLYMHRKNYPGAVKILERSLGLKLKFNDQEQLATTYLNLAEANYGFHREPKAMEYLQKAIVIAKNKHLVEHLEYCYKLEGVFYRALGNFQMSVGSYENYMKLHDSLITATNNRTAAELEEQYQNEKKQKEIELLNKDKTIQENDLKTQKQFNYFIVIVAFMLAVTVFFIFRGLRQKQKDNTALAEKNSIISEQKHLVEEKNREILDSINYAKRIQQSLLANEQMLKQYLPNHFVFFKPKDIVSGDFYWAAKEGDNFYLAICDSTGHGVPGAFMSLLNIGFLAEAIKEKGISSPEKIFDYTRQRLIESISKDGQRDGFDGILVCFDLKHKKITYSAANNSPVLLQDGKLTHLPMDKMPVGLGERKQDFSIFTIDYTPGSVVYFYTDGYADQFGGPKGKKFMYKKLNELLFTNTYKSLEDQKHILQETFESWRGALEQVDDVCVIGIKL